jgi:hypothetical protein
MECTQCHKKNPDNRLYCAACGDVLGWKCECSFVNNIDDNFCGGCGAPASLAMQDKSPIPQLSMKQINDLLQARILFNLGEEDIINQDDIDKIF